MKPDRLKNEYKKMRAPKMDVTIQDLTEGDNLIKQIRSLDKEDQRFLLHRKILPISIGLLILTIVVTVTPINNLLLITGCFLLYTGMIAGLILLLSDYKGISEETFDQSLLDFLQQKKRRLRLWRHTPLSYHMCYLIFIMGLIMTIIGNTELVRELGTSLNVLIFIGIYLFIIFVSWILGEIFYRKRYKKRHIPLIQSIDDQINELRELEKVK